MPVQVIEAGSRTTVIPRAGTRVALPAAANVTVIPQAEQTPHKIRTAYYVRVSSDSDAQHDSNDNMVEHFENLIRNDPNMEYVGGYVDTGISGTSLKNRRAFNQMMEDCKAGKIERILTKSISRWARNTLISIQTVRELKALGVSVFFEKEGLESMEESSEVVFTLLASIAQTESQNISGNIGMGLHFRFAQGVQIVNCSRFLGYDKDPVTKELFINPTEARVVRFIFRSFLEGFSVQEIAKKLRQAHVPTGAGKYDWPVDTIRYMLTNERYMGHAVLQKTVTKDFLSHKSVKNTGQLPQYYLTDCHPAIVPEEVWNLAQSEMVRRGRETGHPGQRRYALSGKVVCGCCGTQYKRFTGTRHAVSTTPPPTDDASTLPALPSTPLPAEPVNSIPAAPGDLEDGRAETSGEEGPENVEHTKSRDAENSGAEVNRGGAVWKCMARCSRKDAASAFQRLSTSSASTSSGGHAIADAAADEHSGARDGNVAGGEVVDPATYRDGLTWRCDNKIIGEERLQIAVDRALALLPREEGNIRLIREGCIRILADTPLDTTVPSTPVGGSGNSGDRRAAAQLLLLHIDSTLSFLHGDGGNSGGRADGLPCTTFQQFVERSAPVLSSTVEGGNGGDAEAVELLIERVVIDGEKIRVIFKAGVEI